jgi:hypothetical protein
MSLTSYRAAPPRGGLRSLEEIGVFLVRFGGDLLSHVLRRSTIGATALNFRVRDGIGCFTRAVATKPEKKHHQLALAACQFAGGSSLSCF